MSIFPSSHQTPSLSNYDFFPGSLRMPSNCLFISHFELPQSIFQPKVKMIIFTLEAWSCLHLLCPFWLSFPSRMETQVLTSTNGVRDLSTQVPLVPVQPSSVPSAPPRPQAFAHLLPGRVPIPTFSPCILQKLVHMGFPQGSPPTLKVTSGACSHLPGAPCPS